MNKSTFLDRKTKFFTILVAVFIFASIGNLNAQISITAKEPTLGQIIQSVKSQSSYQFFYDSKLSTMRVNSVDMKNVTLDSLLNEALKGRGVDYKIEESICFLSVKATADNTKTNVTRVVSGKVVDPKGVPLVGVAVAVVGTTVGVISNGDGRYVANVPAGKTQLSFSYIGYDEQVVTIGTRTTIDITMQESNIMVNDVVVTAMGIKRESKALTYNVQSIATDEAFAVKDANMINNLAGKLAGVTINQSASGVGGSTRVIMRGAKSLFGDNNALYVLDGIPLSSLRSKQSSNYYEVEGQGDSEGISNINPDDIESMSVLTGAAAAALYGNRGSNGVILITTKKGVAGKTTVSYSNNTSFSSPFATPEFQNTYGQSGDSYSSWGSKLDAPSSYNPLDFFQTGASTMNSLSVSSGAERIQMHASAGAVNARGMVPNTEYDRYNFTLRASGELIEDKLDLDVGINYIEQTDQNSIAQGLYYNPLVAVYLFPPADDFNRFVPYKVWNSERNFYTQNWSYQDEPLEGLKQNPLWTANNNLFNNKRDRLILSGSLKYNITEWLNISARARIDKSDAKFERKLYASTNNLFAKSPKGNYSKANMESKNIYADFLINFDKQLSSDFRLTVNAGGSYNDEVSEYGGYDGPLKTVPDFFHIDNVEIERKYREYSHTRTNSFYATAQVGYQNFLYLDATARIDYFSTLFGGNENCYDVYPSVGLSAVLTEKLGINKDILSFWKLRGSYSQVGNPPALAGITRNYTSLDNGAISPTAFYPAVDLKPEKTKAFEVGTDVRLWGNKLNIAFTYYNTNTYNQLFTYDMPSATGYSYAYANAGKVNNWGIELSASLNQKLGPVNWDATLTYSMNRNKIIKLLPESVREPVSGDMIQSPTEFVMSDAGGAYKMILKEGGSMSDIYVNDIVRDGNGFIYVDPGSGRFSVNQDQSKMVKIGSAAPDCNIGFRNGFTWKNIGFNFLIDARLGGVVVSSTQAMMDQYGVSKATANARDNGGVMVNYGKMDTKTYYDIITAGKTGSALAEYTYSATNVRLRELSLAYTLPQKWFRDKLNITVSFIGRNLFMFYNKAPFDPELTANTGTYYQGFDYFMPPSQRSLGFGVNVKF